MKRGHSIPKIQGLCNWSGSTACPCVSGSLYVVEILRLCNKVDIIAAKKISSEFWATLCCRRTVFCAHTCTHTDTNSKSTVVNNRYWSDVSKSLEWPGNRVQIKCAPTLTSARPCYTPTHKQAHTIPRMQSAMMTTLSLWPMRYSAVTTARASSVMTEYEFELLSRCTHVTLIHILLHQSSRRRLICEGLPVQTRICSIHYKTVKFCKGYELLMLFRNCRLVISFYGFLLFLYYLWRKLRKSLSSTLEDLAYFVAPGGARVLQGSFASHLVSWEQTWPPCW